MLYFQLLAVVAVFVLIAWLATGRGGQVGETHPDRPDVALPDDRQLRKPDIDATRFTIGWRGYRMDEVDLVLDRLAAEIEYRDRLIAELLPAGAEAGVEAGGGAGVGAGVEYQPVARSAGSSGAETVAAPGAAVAGVVAAAGFDAGAGYEGSGFEETTEAGAVEAAEVGGTAESSETAETAETAESDGEYPLSAWYRKPE